MSTTEKKRSSTEKAAEAALTRAALTCELAHRWALDAWKADTRIHTDVATDAIHSLDLLTDAARVRALTRQYEDPVLDAEGLKRPIGALMVVLERLAAEDPDNESVADVLAKLREARRELYAVTAHDSGIPVPRDTRPDAEPEPAPERTTEPGPAKLPQLAPIVRDLRESALEVLAISGTEIHDQAYLMGASAIAHALADRLERVEKHDEDAVTTTSAALNLFADWLRAIGEQADEKARGWTMARGAAKVYMNRFADRIDEAGDAVFAIYCAD